MNLIEKEELRKKILSAHSSHIKEYDYSVFGDDDVDVFAELVGFDSYKHNVYPTLSEKLKNNKDIVVKAARCRFNLPFIPDSFFQDKDVIKMIIYNRSEEDIPLHHLNKEVINYMFLTCPRSSLATENIKKACDKHLTKESVIKVLLEQNHFFSDCKKKSSIPCIDNIYIPEHFLQDKDILQLLIIPQFKLIQDNDNITKEMIVELVESGYILSQLPSKFYNDTDLIKKCLQYEKNYYFLDHYDINNIIKENPQLNQQCLRINSNVTNLHNYPLLFEDFKEIFLNDIKKLSCASQVVEKDREQLFEYLTSPDILELFLNKDKNLSEKYDFRIFYKNIFHKNPVIDNKFIIEEIAKQDKYLFPYLSEDVAKDNKFMYKILVENKAEVNFQEYSYDGLYPQINHFGSFKKYVNMLKLDNKLSSKLTQTVPSKTRKI